MNNRNTKQQQQQTTTNHNFSKFLCASPTRKKDSEHISGFGSYRFFSHALERLGPPEEPVPAVTRLPPACPGLKKKNMG